MPGSRTTVPPGSWVGGITCKVICKVQIVRSRNQSLPVCPPMFLRRPSRDTASRGQSLVETALILPLLVLLLVMAIDFGRVFFGWVALQNAARIGADFAAQTANAWDGMPDSGQARGDRDRYAALINGDITAINCDLEGGAPPDPTFEDVDGNLDPYDDGDYAIVELHCSFGLITPLAENVLGGPVAMVAHEEFPVNRRIVQGLPPAPPPPPECPVGEEEVPDMVTNTMGAARDEWVAAGFVQANFDPPRGVVSTGPPANRNVNKIVLTQSLPEGECAPVTAVVDVTHTP